MQSGPSCFCCVSLPLNLCAAPWRTLCPRCRALICWAAGGTRWMSGCCCSPATAVLGTWCLYRRAAKALDARLTKFDAVVLAICIAASAAFYLHAMVGRQSLYLWDNATYYNLQIRLESNFADGVFTGVGSTIYKTWFNDYAPLVINLLAEPFFMFTPLHGQHLCALCGLLVPTLVYYSAWVLLGGAAPPVPAQSAPPVYRAGPGHDHPAAAFAHCAVPRHAGPAGCGLCADAAGTGHRV